MIQVLCLHFNFKLLTSVIVGSVNFAYIPDSDSVFLPLEFQTVLTSRYLKNTYFLLQDAHNDSYCWICHKEGEVICCETCPRVFHIKCIQLETAPTEDWVCPECVLILTAENMGTR
jgi:hypothetical protein